MPGIYDRPEFPLAERLIDQPAEELKPSPPPKPVKPTLVRIGCRVRLKVGDCFIDQGTTGLVVNVSPPRFGIRKDQTARVLWDNDCVSMASVVDLEIVDQDVVQPE